MLNGYLNPNTKARSTAARVNTSRGFGMAFHSRYRARSRQPDHEWLTADSRAASAAEGCSAPILRRSTVASFLTGSLARIQNASSHLRIAKERTRRQSCRVIRSSSRVVPPITRRFPRRKRARARAVSREKNLYAGWRDIIATLRRFLARCRFIIVAVLTANRLAIANVSARINGTPAAVALVIV